MRPPSVEGGVLSELVLVLGVVGALLVVVALVTAQRPRAPVPDRDGFFDRWQALHGGHDPRASAWVRGWLTVVHRIARPLARRGVAPHALTAISAWLAALALVPAAAGGRWAVLAAWLVVASGLLDGLDGAVAALAGRATPLGSVLDAVGDRLTEVVFLGAVVLAGGAVGLAVACGALFWFHEYVRARAAAAGADEIGAVTVAERPQRVIVLALALHAAGMMPADAELAAGAGLAVMLALSAVGLVQLSVAVGRRLAGADHSGG